MKAVLSARLIEDQLRKAAKARQKAKAKKTKQKAAKSSSSSESTTSTSNEGERPPQKVISTSKGKEATQKAPAKAAPKAVSAAMPKGKRALEETLNVAMLPDHNTPVA